MKLFKYNQFISESNEDIHSICKKYGITNYTINEDGTVDVDGCVNLNQVDLIKIPLKFGEVTGYFDCSYNNLITLKGCPEKVGGGFYCNNNRLTSLEGGPKEVGEDFGCSCNSLRSLKGGPQKVGGFFDCSENFITSFEGCPKELDFDIGCGDNKITNFKGFPEILKGYLYIANNPVYEILDLFPYEIENNKKCDEIIEYLNEYNVIIDGNKVVLQALELVYDELGLEVPNEIYIEGYEII